MQTDRPCLFSQCLGKWALAARRAMIRPVRGICAVVKRLAHKSSTTDVLFVAETPLMFSYLEPIWRRLAPDPRLNLRFCFDREFDSDMKDTLLAQQPRPAGDIQTVSYRFAMVWPWDLIFFADITPTHRSFWPGARKINAGHGLPAGKFDKDGVDPDFGAGRLDSKGNVAFDLMFEPGEHSIDQAKLKYPKFVGHLVSVGDLRMDNLLEVNDSRAAIREQLGIAPDKTAVLIISSWGPNSLVQTIGEELFLQLELLKNQYHFMISIHPNNYDLQRSGGKDFTAAVKKQRQLGTTVARPAEDWAKYLAAADILVTDFTSLSLYFVPLLRPIVCVPIAETFGHSAGLMYAVQRIAVPLTAPENLADALAKARQLDISQEHRKLAERIFSHRRNSWRQMSRQIYKLLDLPEPTS